MIRRVYGIVPVFIIVTSNLPPQTGARTNGIFIRVRPEYQHDEPRTQHELTHVRQKVRSVFRPWAWLANENQEWEIEAYREQLRHYAIEERPARIAEFATYLSNGHYNTAGFNMTFEDAEAALR